MDCPNCGTYNPEDRTTCWRCNAELPRVTPRKKRDPQKSAQMWLYVAIAVFFLITILQTCGVKLPFGPRLPEQPGSGSYVPSPPAVVYETHLTWPFL
jgi:predicted nucleic acid-binding Zn ribbon protein